MPNLIIVYLQDAFWYKNHVTITVYFAFFGSFSFSCAKYAKDFS